MNLIKMTVAFLLIIFYLFFSYIRFYHYIGDADLQSPYFGNPILFENSDGEGSAKYVALGDSLSAGVGSTTVDKTFVYLYAEKLSEKYKQVEILNLAQPGGTTVDVINNQLPLALIADPEYVTLLIGVNDIHNKRSNNDFNENFTHIINELISKTNAEILVIEIPYIGSYKIVYPPFNYLLSFRTNQFNKTIYKSVNKFAVTNRVKVVPIYKETLIYSKDIQGYYSSDLFHPSGEGYLLWGKLINEY